MSPKIAPPSGRGRRSPWPRSHTRVRAVQRTDDGTARPDVRPEPRAEGPCSASPAPLLSVRSGRTALHLAARVGAKARAVPRSHGALRPAPLGPPRTSWGCSARPTVEPFGHWRVGSRPPTGSSATASSPPLCWNTARPEAALARDAQHLDGGAGSVLVIDDTALSKMSEQSVGLAHQSCGAPRKTATSGRSSLAGCYPDRPVFARCFPGGGSWSGHSP
jgi:hypothetical protein